MQRAVLAFIGTWVLVTSDARADPEPAPKRLETAWIASTATTLAGAAMVAGGFSIGRDDGRRENVPLALVLLGGGTAALVVGPSTGHWYAGTFLTPGLGIRAAGVGAFAVAMSTCGRCDAQWLLAGTAGILAVGTAYDLATLRRRVRERNRRDLVIAPVAARDRAGVVVAVSW